MTTEWDRPHGRELTYRAVLRLLRVLLGVLTRTHRAGLSRIPAAGPVLVVGNHISLADPVAMVTTLAQAGRRPRAMATAGLFTAPVLGLLLRHFGFVPVHRHSTTPATALGPAAAALAHGEAVLLYPEGRITTDPDYWPLPGRTGVVRLALDSGAPVVPVAQWGAQHLLGRRRPMLSLLTAVFHRPRLALRVGEAMDLRSLLGLTCAAEARPEDLRRGTDLVMDALERELAVLRGRHRQTVHTGPEIHAGS